MSEENREELVKLMRAYHNNYRKDPNRVKGALIMKQAADLIDEMSATIEQQQNDRWRQEKTLDAMTKLIKGMTEEIAALREHTGEDAAKEIVAMQAALDEKHAEISKLKQEIAELHHRIAIWEER